MALHFVDAERERDPGRELLPGVLLADDFEVDAWVERDSCFSGSTVYV
jgi:hypothetical protein